MRRDESLFEQLARAVEVPHDRVEQVCPLLESVPQVGPFVGADDDGDGVEHPVAGLPEGVGRAVADAVVGDQPARLGARDPQRAQAHPVERRDEALLVGGSAGVEQFVEAAAVRPVGVDDARSGLEGGNAHAGSLPSRCASAADTVAHDSDGVPGGELGILPGVKRRRSRVVG